MLSRPVGPSFFPFLAPTSPPREDASLPLFSPLSADSLWLDRRHVPPSSFRKHTIFPPWWKSSADILLTGLRVQEEEARFAPQEVDVDLEQLRRRGYLPGSLYLRPVGWWGEFLNERKR